MFLTKDNKLKWAWIAWGAVITAMLVAAGVAWFDIGLYTFMRQFDCGVCKFFDTVFDAKKWLVISGIVVVVFYFKKVYEVGAKYKNARGYVNLWAILNDFFDKVRTSRAFFIFCSVLSASIIAKVLKVLIGRARPIFYEALNMTGFFPLNFEWAFNSMPSGHTVATFAGLVMLGMLVPKIKWATWSLAILVGASRVCVGAHWPSDVILGAFIGMVVADFVKYYLKRRIVQ